MVKITQDLEMSRNCSIYKHIEIMLLVVMFQQAVERSDRASVDAQKVCLATNLGQYIFSFSTNLQL